MSDETKQPPAAEQATTQPPADPPPADDVEEIDAEGIATKQVHKLIRDRKAKVSDVPEAKLALAIRRHAGIVRKAGGPVDPDFWTQQFVDANRKR